jgi:hypothetical protein
MERPPPPGRRSLWDDIGKPAVIVLTFILIFSFTFFILVYLTKEPAQYDHFTAPTGAFDMEYNNSTESYRLYVISLSEETLEIDEIFFTLLNDNFTVSHDLPAVVDNENSNVTFHDMDNDGLYSGGDEFIIDGYLIEPGSVFKVIWNKVGKLMMEYKFLD